MFGRQREAVEDFARTVELDDTHIDAWASIAKRVDVRQALEIYLRLTELAPDRPDWYAHVGIIYANAGDTRRAIEYYTHSLEADPDYSYSRRYRGQMYNRLGRYQDEVADHTYLIENVDDRNWVVRAYYDRAIAYDNAGEHALAEADYRTSIQMGNRMPAAYSNLGWTYQQRSMWEDAIEAHPGKS